MTLPGATLPLHLLYRSPYPREERASFICLVERKVTYESQKR
jgi:hypothetical protein